MINWDILRSDQMHTGLYKGRPVWSNSYMLEFAPPPSELGSTWNELKESVVAKLVFQPPPAHPIIGIGDPQDGADRLYFRAGEIYGAVNRYYWGYFQERYPDMEALASTAESQLQIKSKGKLVGLLMPQFSYKAKENYLASTISELRSSATPPFVTITALPPLAVPITLAPPTGPHRCRDCAEYSNAYWDFPDNTREGVAACLLGKWPKPHVRKISMVLRNRPPLREIGAKCKLWKPRP